MNKPANLTPEQLGFVLGDIANTARNIKAVCVLLCDELGSSETDTPSFLASAAASLAERIGFVADMAAGRSPDTLGPVVGDAVQWMMPPRFHELSKRQAQEEAQKAKRRVSP